MSADTGTQITTSQTHNSPYSQLMNPLTAFMACSDSSALLSTIAWLSFPNLAGNAGEFQVISPQHSHTQPRFSGVLVCDISIIIIMINNLGRAVWGGGGGGGGGRKVHSPVPSLHLWVKYRCRKEARKKERREDWFSGRTEFQITSTLSFSLPTHQWFVIWWLYPASSSLINKIIYWISAHPSQINCWSNKARLKH